MPDVVFTMDADEAKVVSAFRKMIEADGKLRAGMKKTARGSKTATASMVSDLKRVALQTFAISKVGAAIKKVYSDARAEIRKTAETGRAVQAQFIDLQFLGENFRDPDFRRKTFAAAAAAGIQPGEFAVGKHLFESTTSGLAPGLQQALLPEAIAIKRTTSLDLGTLSGILGKAGALTTRGKGETDEDQARRIANVVLETMEQASAGPQQFASQFPRAIAAGAAGGLTLTESGALFATLTEISGTTERAAGAMDIIVRQLTTPGELLKGRGGAGAGGPFGGGGGGVSRLGGIFKEAGITEDDNALARLRKLSPQFVAGKMTKDDVKKLFGAEALPSVVKLLGDPGQLKKYTGRIAEAGASEISLAPAKRATALAIDPILRATQEGEELRSAITGAQALRVDPLLIENERLKIRLAVESMRQRGAPALATSALETGTLATFDILTTLGGDIETARGAPVGGAAGAATLGQGALIGRAMENLLKSSENLDRAAANLSAGGAARQAGADLER